MSKSGHCTSDEDMSLLMRTFNARVQSVMAGGSSALSLFSPSQEPHQSVEARVAGTPTIESVDVRQGTTLQNLFDSRKQDVLNVSASGSVSSSAPSTQHFALTTGDDSAKTLLPSQFARDVAATALAQKSASGKSNKKSFTALMQAGPPFIRAAGGWGFFLSIPFVVFGVVLIMLYITVPSFVRKKPKYEFEVAPVNHTAVVAVAGSCGALVLIITVAWCAYSMSNAKKGA